MIISLNKDSFPSTSPTINKRFKWNLNGEYVPISAIIPKSAGIIIQTNPLLFQDQTIDFKGEKLSDKDVDTYLNKIPEVFAALGPQRFRNKAQIDWIFNEYINYEISDTVLIGNDSNIGSAEYPKLLDSVTPRRCVILQRSPAVVNKYNNYYYTSVKMNNSNNDMISIMFSLLVKKEWIPYIRACILTKSEINPEVLRFVINPIVFSEIKNPILKHVKKLMKDFSTQNIECLVDDKIDSNYLRTFKILFKTLQDKEIYNRTILTRVINEIKKDYGIVDKASELDKMIESIIVPEVTIPF